MWATVQRVTSVKIKRLSFFARVNTVIYYGEREEAVDRKIANVSC